MRARMPKTVHCAKLKQDLPGFDAPPIKGDLGQRIMNEVSKQAWDQWMEHAKMIINEYRLNMASADARAVMRKEMEKFFFGEGAAPPPDFVPVNKT